MTYLDLRKLDKIGIVAIGCAVIGACSSAESTNSIDPGHGTGAGGGTGGAMATTAATSTASASSSAATTASASGSSTGTGGQIPFACKPFVPPAPLITDFSDFNALALTWGTPPALTGGLFTYPETIKATASSAAKQLTASGQVTTYSGFGLFFDACVDASSFKGVSFTIGVGAGTSGTMAFSILSNSTFPIDAMDQLGACPFDDDATKYSECLYPRATITVPAVAGTVSVLWSDFDKVPMSKPMQTGASASAELWGVQWAFDWTPGTPSSMASATVSNVTFM